MIQSKFEGKKLEITAHLETLKPRFDDPSFIAILNLPGTNLCEKREEKIEAEEGKLELACKGCITEKIRVNQRLTIAEIDDVIRYFHREYGTEIITINGRGDPFHPEVIDETLRKIKLASSLGMISYVFSGGNNLDDGVCRFLAEKGANVMMSLHGNRFIDARFFDERMIYPKLPDQDQNQIASNFRRLISAYSTAGNQPPAGTTRLAMNYVLRQEDLADDTKLAGLKQAAELVGLFLICNLPFERQTPDLHHAFTSVARRYSTLSLSHSTFVDGQCQMGAGSSITVDCGNKGSLYRCPYQFGQGDGNFFALPEDRRKAIISDYLLSQRNFACVMRKTPRLI